MGNGGQENSALRKGFLSRSVSRNVGRNHSHCFVLEAQRLELALGMCLDVASFPGGA